MKGQKKFNSASAVNRFCTVSEARLVRGRRLQHGARRFEWQRRILLGEALAMKLGWIRVIRTH
jgi:hypothetical protein